MARILTDPALKKSFDRLDKTLTKNQRLQELRDYLAENLHIVPLLKDLLKLKQKVWVSFLNASRDALSDLAQEYRRAEVEIKEITEIAKREKTAWADVVKTFNDRFHVPFQLEVENQAEVILQSEAPQLKFIFTDGESRRPAEDTQLLKVLSQGERRALYLLNVLFELRIRETNEHQTLVVVDDIADSFDYKNKYAIIEYLHDVAHSGRFKLLLLTHNFDFHRSATKRIDIRHPSCWLATRTDRNIVLEQEKYKNSPFRLWTTRQRNDPSSYIASIPFARNIAEYCGYEATKSRLTSTLHIKPGTSNLLLSDVDQDLSRIINDYSPPTSPGRDVPYFDFLDETAASIAAEASSHLPLEKKIVLSIAIRLNAERYMIHELGGWSELSGITKNQTRALVNRYTNKSPSSAALPTLHQVQLMTPENIHLNSFMFEPILDLGAVHLVKLYLRTTALWAAADGGHST